MSAPLARPLAAAAFASFLDTAAAAFVDKGFGTFSCFDCECQSPSLPPPSPPPLPPLPAFPPSPPPTCEDDGNPVQRLAAGAVAGAFAAAAIYGRAPTKRTRNVKTQTPPQPYVPPPPPSRHCQTDLPRDQECQTAPLPPPPPNSIEREMQTVPTTYYFDAGAQTDAAASASAGVQAVATAREVGAMTLPLELFEQQELQRLALAGRPPAPAASAAACQTEPPPRAHSTSQTNLPTPAATQTLPVTKGAPIGTQTVAEDCWVGVPAVTQTVDTGTNVLTVEYQHKAVIVNRGAQTVDEAIEMASAATQSEERHRLATDRPPLREYVGNF